MDKAFFKDFMKDIPRGDSTRDLSQQYAPCAQWMKLEDIAANKDLAFDPHNPGAKVLIGALGSQLIGIDDDRHIMTVAGSRSGKSVGLISNLFFYRGSVLATDPKGELANITAERRAKLGQKIYVLDPFLIASDAIGKYRAAYNPMVILKPDNPNFLEDAALIAEALVVQSGQEKDPHWDESAKAFIEAVIVHVATAPQYADARNLITVRYLISRALWNSLDMDALDSPEASDNPALLQDIKLNAASLRDAPLTEDIGNSLIAGAMDFYLKAEAERAGVYSTVNRHTRFLDYTAFRNVLCDNDFDLGELKRNPNGVSVYLCFPATRADISRRWMRLFINQLLDAMDREKTKPKVPVLACLDEFPVLGYMKQLETAAGLIASFGVRLWFILQDWSQGKALYGDRWETFAGNAGTMQFFGNNDLATTEYISRRLGKTLVQVTRLGEVGSEQRDKGLLGKSVSTELHDLLDPAEVTQQFSRDDKLKKQVIFLAGNHPIMLQRTNWHDNNGPLAKFITSN
ncbi:MAG: type IV secretory system conjugative DNA transfer family protein [Steroidobacteraceae bacterium]